MKKYPKYKDSGVEWIGEIPEGWRIIKLKYCCSVTTGGKDTQNKIDDGAYPFYVRSPQVERINTYSYDGEAVLTAGDGVGTGKVFHYAKGKFDFHQRVYKFSEFKHLTGKFFYEYIRSLFINVVEDQTAKSTVDSLRMPMIQGFLFTLPPIQEQKQIVTYLDHKTTLIDQIISGSEKKIELLKERRTATINHAVTKGLNPKVKMKDSGVEWIGEIPEGWEVTPLKYVTSINANSLSENTNPNYELEYIEISDVNNRGEILQTTKYTYSEAPSRCRRILSKGDVFISTVRTYLKSIGYVKEEVSNLICSTGFCVVTPTKISSEFLFYMVLNDWFINQVISNSEGVSYPSITSTELVKIKILLPKSTEQQQIVTYLDQKTKEIDDLISSEQKRIELMKEYRQSLISEVVTGKIKII